MLSTDDLVRVPCPVCGSDEPRPERTLDGFQLTRCTRCAMVYANPRLGTDQLIAGYDDHGDHAGTVHRTEDLARYYAHRTDAGTIAQFDRILGDLARLTPEGGRLLDFGCGAAYFVERAQQWNLWEVHGVEIGGWAEAEARRRGLRNIHMGPLEEQDFGEGFFDVIHAGQVLEHLDSPRDILKEIHRVLRPGGIFYANVPNYGRLSIRLGRDRFESNRPMGHLSYFTDSSLRRLLAEVGFRPLRTWTYGGLNWENIVGREIHRTLREQDLAENTPIPDPFDRVPPPGDTGSGDRGVWRRAAEKILYGWGRFGIELEIFAERI